MLRRGLVSGRKTERKAWWIVASLLAALLLAVGAVSPAQQEEREAVPPEAPEKNPIEAKHAAQVLSSLVAQEELLESLILDAVREYRRIAMERTTAHKELGTVEAQLDRVVTRVREVSSTELEQVVDKLRAARVRYRALAEAEGRKLGLVEQFLRQQEGLEQRIAELRAESPMEEGVLTGEWEVVWRPSNLRGTFFLDQSGTLVTGQYRLGSRRTGSLRGTFVGNKVRLERVDSDRGRDAELEGYLSSDGNRIEGTWQSYEMVQGGIPRGQWVATRAE